MNSILKLILLGVCGFLLYMLIGNIKIRLMSEEKRFVDYQREFEQSTGKRTAFDPDEWPGNSGVI